MTNQLFIRNHEISTLARRQGAMTTGWCLKICRRVLEATRNKTSW